MQLDQERKIKRNLIALKRDMDAKDLIDYFIEKDLFDFKDFEEINGFNPNTTESRNNRFFHLLFQSGPQAYDVFVYALRSCHLDHLADLVENTQVNDAASQQSEPFSWINTISQPVRERKLNEKDISRLAQTLGNDWQLVVYEMGLSKVEVEHCIMENQTPVMQIYSALHKWRVKNPDDCTLSKFVNIVKDCQATSVDWNQMKRIASAMQ